MHSLQQCQPNHRFRPAKKSTNYNIKSKFVPKFYAVSNNYEIVYHLSHVCCLRINASSDGIEIEKELINVTVIEIQAN